MKGTLRIWRSSTDGLNFADDSSHDKGDNYVTRLLKLIPSDILALYIFGQNTIPDENVNALLVFTIVCSVLLVLTRMQLTSEGGGQSPQWAAIFISLISFFIWVYSIGQLFVKLGWHEKWIATLMMAVWVFVVPYIYKGDLKT